MTIKKAYVRTEIIKYLDKFKSELGREMTGQDVLNELPNIYKKLEADPEQPIGGVPYMVFFQAASHVADAYRQAGYTI